MAGNWIIALRSRAYAFRFTKFIKKAGGHVFTPKFGT